MGELQSTTLKSTGRTAIALCASMMTLATAAIGFRGFARTKALMTATDWLILYAYLNFCVYSAVFIRGIQTSGGTLDRTQMTVPEFENLYKFNYVLEILFTTTISAVKISVLLFYTSIFPTTLFRRQAQALGGLCIVWALACLLLTILQCQPVKAAWELGLVAKGAGSCIPFGKVLLGYELTNMIIDIAILALPINIIRGLQMRTSRKVALSCVFLLGGFVCIVCVIRLIYLYNSTNANPNNLPTGLNWSIVELALAIVCACLPTYGKLFSNIISSIKSLILSLKSLRKWPSQSGRTTSRARKECTPNPDIVKMPNDDAENLLETSSQNKDILRDTRVHSYALRALAVDQREQSR